MKYDTTSIEVIDDPVAFIRRRPEMFVAPGVVRPELLATCPGARCARLWVRACRGLSRR